MKYAILLVAFWTTAPAATLHLLQKPAMNKTEIVFSYAGDLWSVSRQGGVAQRLTTGQGSESDAAFSPDGKTIAFSGEYDGNVDVFTVPVTGGIPKRLTYHPAADRVSGWTPDGKQILFRSNRDAFSRYTQLYTVSTEGGLPSLLPLPMGYTGSYSADGKRMAYQPLDGGQFTNEGTNFVSWRRYRGGRASYIWLVNFADLATQKLPRTDSNDFDPMWIGNKVYFLSDRNGPATLYSYDPQSKQVAKLIENTGRDIISASAGPGGIVYEQFGQIHIFDVASGKEHAVPIEITSDLTEVRPHFQNVAREIREASISPTGMRMVFEAHGEILTAPAEKGDVRNLTNSPGVMDRTPAWSPDGHSIAYFSDESGEYALHIRAQSGDGETRKLPLAGKSAFYFNPKWSPDSKYIAFADNQLNVWNVDVASGKLSKVDSDYFYEGPMEFTWAGDSKWIGYSKTLPNRLHAIFVYSLDSQKSDAGDRRDERCAASGIRPRRAISVFHGEHELRAVLERAGYDQRSVRGEQQHLPGGTAEQHSVSTGSGERRRGQRAAGSRSGRRTRRARREWRRGGGEYASETGADRLRETAAAHHCPAGAGALVPIADGGEGGDAVHRGERHGRRERCGGRRRVVAIRPEGAQE